MSPTPAVGNTAITCGQPLRIPSDDRLILKGGFPANSATGQRTVAGTVEVTSRITLKGVTAPQADVFLAQDGRAVTVPAPQDLMGVRWDLAAGVNKHLPAEITLSSCAPGGEPLPPGRYELYARVVVVADDGARVESFGGPWAFELR
jgi:hypothetical protein